MQYINIDIKSCTGCGICEAECPADLISIEGGLSRVEKDGVCFSCGHCAAICPKGVITSTNELDNKGFKVETSKSGLEADRCLFQNKRSIRNFTDKKISSEKLKNLIQHAEMAPAAHNIRDRKYIILTDPTQIEKLHTSVILYYKNLLKILNPVIIKLISFFNKKLSNELHELVISFKKLLYKHSVGKDSVFRNPSCVICIAAPKSNLLSKDNCVASQHYMMLYGEREGISSYIVGYAQVAQKRIDKHLNLPKGYSIYAVSSFGYAKNRYKNSIKYKTPDIIWK